MNNIHGRSDGMPIAAKHAKQATAGDLVEPDDVGSTQHIYIIDIMAQAASTLRQTSTAGETTGDIVTYVPACGLALNAAIKVPAGKGLYVSAGAVAINYYIS